MAKLSTFTVSELLDRDFDPVSFVVPRFIPIGLTLLAGKPKIGKSWLLLNIARAVAQGGVLFGEVTEPGSVLVLALEDNERRLKARLKTMLGSSPPPETMHMTTKCPRIGEGCEQAITEWVKTADRPRLVIVDVLGQVRPKSDSKRAYDDDYAAIGPLKKIADDAGIAIIVCHHTRKEQAADPFDAISGTTGLAGASDTVIIMDRGPTGTTLYGRGRDLEEFEVMLSFDPRAGSWRLVGDAAEATRSVERTAILAALRQIGAPTGPKEVADAARLSAGSVKKMMPKMVAAGDLVKMARGTYWLADQPDPGLH
ncbi:AAA family ATPase [Kaistia dalseonensis]|uniref:AAA family ATPase n=1 Tax=Kaistia dalseonensis TaxID=410840 RepID=A0ABU0H8Z4_9HYPH|nr:AAA family ATPase [Kaistia dalseonensis]MCX5496177.1 AAA family ATPase [Kaistia dalseonensis]MDQ0438788.1 hypothetical protein [Kaistia dalseonensis]